MFQGGGNIPLIAPIAGELVERGHTVSVLAGPGVRRSRIPLGEPFLRRMLDAGCELAHFTMPEVHPFDGDDAPRGATRRWVPQAFVREAREAHTTVWSPYWAQNVTQGIEQQAPDLVVADYMLLGAFAAAEARAVPSVALVHTVPPPLAASPMPPQSQGFMPAASVAEELKYEKWRSLIRRTWIREGLEPHNRARQELGLDRISEPRAQLRSCARVLTLANRDFDFAGHLPENTTYVGTPIDDLDATGSWTPPWPPDDERPLLLISLSTLAQGQAAVLGRCIEAGGSLALRVLVTLGPSLKREDFARPANAVFESFVPHSAVLPYASAVISQCGLGTLTKTLRHGLPMVCIPLLGDQPDNAARIVARGAGVRLAPDASADAIRAAVQQVIADPSYRAGAVALSNHLKADGAGRAADEIEGVVRGFEPGRSEQTVSTERA